MLSPSHWLVLEGRNSGLLVQFLLLALLSLLAAPRQDRRRWAGYAFVVGGIVASYAANHSFLFWIGWTISVVPWLMDQSIRPSSRISLAAGCLAVAAGLLLIEHGIHRDWGLVLLMLAVVQRKGLFPFHGWVADTFERTDVLQSSLLFNSHLGAFVVMLTDSSAFLGVPRPALTLLADLGLATAVLAALAAVSERNPRRQLAFISISQASIILAGIEGASRVAVSGAMLHWIVVPLATTALAAILRGIEVRETPDWNTFRNGGLAGRYPRLAVFFAIAALALVGLPGTLGFVSEDLLLHGALQTHPWIGLAIPVSTALNAITLFRLFSRIFLGARRSPSAVIPDATLRERVALTLIAALLIGFGLFPNVPLGLTSPTAEIAAGAGWK